MIQGKYSLHYFYSNHFQHFYNISIFLFQVFFCKIIPGCYRNDELARVGYARENRTGVNVTVLYIATGGNGNEHPNLDATCSLSLSLSSL